MSATGKKLACQVVIVGAGPYGLAAAAHLRAVKVETQVFGEAMEFWERHMPAGMFLRSPWEGSHISDPARNLTLDRYKAIHHNELMRPIPLAGFVNYGQWFQKLVVPDLDHRRVVRIEPVTEGFQVSLNDGAQLATRHVAIATGLAAFAWHPPEFAGLPSALVSHTSEHRDLWGFAGQRMIVVGGGQSALESAALLNQAGAEVEVVVRAPEIRWLRDGSRPYAWRHSRANPIRPLLYPPGNIGPPVLNWIVEMPDLFMRLPLGLQQRIATRAIRPAATGWVRPRLAGVRITTGHRIVSANPHGDRLRLRLDDASERCADHILLGTGYRVDVSRYTFLAPELVRAVRLVDGCPQLGDGFESSVAGLHFLGAPAARTFGPVCRFVAGTRYSASALTRYVLGQTRKRAKGSSIDDRIEQSARPSLS